VRVGSFVARSVAAGSAFSCAVGDDGSLSCWGLTSSGRVGFDSAVDVNVPTAVPLANVAVLATRAARGAALVGQDLLTWGDPTDGALGRGGTSTPPAPIGGGFSAVALGASHGCGIKGAALYCWGTNQSGELGANGVAPSAVPVRSLQGLDDVVEVALGSGFGCVRRQQGEVQCWGRNDRGQLGRGVQASTATGEPAAPVGGGRTYRAVAAGAAHACAIEQSGVLDCWGDNTNGQIGLKDPVVLVPTPVVLP
jgi:alpha-tubulin suppressor-like RCC1 family protein